MRMLCLSSMFLVLCAQLARAEANEASAGDDDDGSEESEPGLVLVNAAQRGLGDIGKVEKLRKVLLSRGMLHKLPRRLEAALDGRALQVSDPDRIKEAAASEEFELALKIVGEEESRILKSAAAGDPLPALAELAEWRGLIEAARNNEDEAIEWFRASYRFNPARTIDKRLASPTARGLIKQARKDDGAVGKIRVDSDPDGAQVSIDGGKPQQAGNKIELPIGYHLVTITAEGRTSYSEIVKIEEGKLEKFAIALDKESTDDKAARLVDATVSAARHTGSISDQS